LSFNPYDFIGRDYITAEQAARSSGLNFRIKQTGNIREGSRLRVIKAEMENNIVTLTVAGFFDLPKELREKNMGSR